MIKKYNDDNYYNMVNNILDTQEFLKIDNCIHHGISRLEHSLRVSYYSYKIAKFLRLDYKVTARAGLLHDFFTNEDQSRFKSYFNHSKIALENANKLFILSDKEKDIIKTHMFPANIGRIPKYLESWIVGVVDKVSCIYEISLSYSRLFRFKLQNALVIVLFLSRRFF